MHLRELENYIAELASKTLESNGAFEDTEEIVRRLMDILIIEESRIPDFVIDGDSIYNYDEEECYFCIDSTESVCVEDIMKKTIWTMATIIVAGFTGLIGFLYGFFTAPEKGYRK